MSRPTSPKPTTKPVEEATVHDRHDGEDGGVSGRTSTAPRIPKTRTSASARSSPDLVPPEKKPRISYGLKPAQSPSSHSTKGEGAPMDVDATAEGSSGLGSGHAPSTASASDRLSSKDRKLIQKLEKKRKTRIEKGSFDEVVWAEIRELLGAEAVDEAVAERRTYDQVFEYKEEVELKIEMLSSSGDGMARAPEGKPPWAVLVPFTLPGETVKARVFKNEKMHSLADVVEVIVPNTALRDDSRSKCKYFGQCGGCQYQMLSYEQQLEFKRDVVVRAYKTFSELPSSAVPEILPTFPSPQQYGYRTKLTPHFDIPNSVQRALKSSKLRQERLPDGTLEIPPWLKIGFTETGGGRVMDIEDCPIATPAINEAYIPLRDKIHRTIADYQRSATLLLRDSLVIPPRPKSSSFGLSSPKPAPSDETTVVTDPNSTVREKVGPFYFDYKANEFFQNNNCVLEPLLGYVRDAIFPPPSDGSASASDTTPTGIETPRPTHLVDAYCGAGLFAIGLSPHFERVAGIEISKHAIDFAQHNVKLNSLSPSEIDFVAGDATDIFARVSTFPRVETAVVIDPPRRGTSADFIRQLVDFGPGTVVYVSCNVHTQARDVGMILRAAEAKGDGARYVLESVRGFDLFPQTAHVEGVAVLRRVES